METTPMKSTSLKNRKVLLALNSGRGTQSTVAEWQRSLMAELSAQGAELTVSLPCLATDPLALEAEKLSVATVISPGDSSQRDKDGWLEPWFHARAVISQAKDYDAEVVIAHGYDLARTLAGGKALSRSLWSVICDEPTGEVDFAPTVAQHLPALAAGSRRIVVFSEEQRSYIETTAVETTGKTSVFPFLNPVQEAVHPAEYSGDLPTAWVIRLGGSSAPMLEPLRDVVEHFKTLDAPPPVYVVGSAQQYREFRGQKEHALSAALPGARLIAVGDFRADELSRTHRLVGLHGTDPDDTSDPRTEHFWFGAYGMLMLDTRDAAVRFSSRDPSHWERVSFVDDTSDLWQPAPVWRQKHDLASFAEPLIADYATVPPINPIPKVLLVGADFKFAGDLVDGLYQRSDIELKVDLWANNSTPQPDVSEPLLEWADIIICEFASVNAIWYSNHVRPGQRLIVRLHGYELLADWIHNLNYSAIDTLVFVSEFYREKALAKMGWDRSRTAVIPNTIHADDLDRPKFDDARFHLGIAGIVPILKRPDRALDLLEILLRHDDRYTLHIRGHAPWNYNWEWRKPRHRDSYREFYRRIGADENLRRHIAFEGFAPDMGNWFRKIGWMLSPSYRETFHLAPVEGMASGALPVVWNREGAQEIFPPEHVHESTEEAARRILEINENVPDFIAASETAKQAASRYDAAKVRSRWLELISRPGVRLQNPGGHRDSTIEVTSLIEALQGRPSTQNLLAAASYMWHQGKFEAALGLLDDHIGLTARATGDIKDFENWVRGVFALEARTVTLLPPEGSGPVYRPRSRTPLLVRSTAEAVFADRTADPAAPLTGGYIEVEPPAFLAPAAPVGNADVVSATGSLQRDPMFVGRIASDSSLRFNHHVNKIAAELAVLAKAKRASQLLVEGDVWLALPALMAGRRLGIPVVWDVREHGEVVERISAAVADPYVRDPLALLAHRVAGGVERLVVGPDQFNPLWTQDSALLSTLLPDPGAVQLKREIEALRSSPSPLARTLAGYRIGVVAGEAVLETMGRSVQAVALTSENYESEITAGLDAVIVDTSADLPGASWSGRVGHGGADKGAGIVALLTACRVGGVRSVFWNRHDKKRYPQYWGIARKTDAIVTSDLGALPSYLRMNPAVHETAVCAVDAPPYELGAESVAYSARKPRIAVVDPLDSAAGTEIKRLALRLRHAGHRVDKQGHHHEGFRFAASLCSNDGSYPQGAAAWTRTISAGTPLLSPKTAFPAWEPTSAAQGHAMGLASALPGELAYPAWHRLVWDQLVEAAQGNTMGSVLAYILRSLGLPVDSPAVAPLVVTASHIGPDEVELVLGQTVLPDRLIAEGFDPASRRVLEEAGITCAAESDGSPTVGIQGPLPPLNEPDFYDRALAWMSLSGASELTGVPADETAPMWSPIEESASPSTFVLAGAQGARAAAAQLQDPISPAGQRPISQETRAGGDREDLAAGVSVVIATFQGVGRIGETLGSLAHQTLDNDLIELVVVGNGPEDGTRGIVEEFQRNHPSLQTVFTHLAEAGVAPARNKGISLASRQSVVFVDDDDQVESNYLLALWLRSAPATMVLGRLHDVDENDDVKIDTPSTRRADELGYRVLPLANRAGALGLNGAKLLPTSYARNCSYDPDLRSGEDVAFMAQLLRYPEMRVTAAVPMASDAYLRTLRPESISRRDLTFDFSVKERLDVISRLRTVKTEATSKSSQGAADYLASGQARFVARYLGEHPEEGPQVQAEIQLRQLGMEPAVKNLVT